MDRVTDLVARRADDRPNQPAPRILIATTHPWRSPIQVGAHAYARQFAARGWRVGMISMPLTVLHLAKLHAVDVRTRWSAWRAPCGSGVVDDITPLTILPLIGPGLRSRFLLRRWHKATVPSLVRVLRKHGWLSPEVLLYDSPVFLGLSRDLDTSCRIYRVADYLPGFRNAPKVWHAFERQAVRAADITLYATPQLREHVESLGARDALLVQNGVDVDFFQRSAAEPDDLREVPHPRAIYVGELREWFDYEAVNALCSQRPDLHVVVIGPTRNARFVPSWNLHLLGPRSRADLPGYLQHCDVGLIPFDAIRHGELVSKINPLKLYEYAACGLPTVAASWEVVRQLKSPALLYETHDELVDCVGRALQQNRQLSDDGRAWVRGYDWAERLQPLWSRLARTGFDAS